MTLKTIDFFAGGGGLSLGFQRAGFDLTCAVENWPPALAIYRANFTDHDAVSIDLSDEKAALALLDCYKPNLIIGGPPCQDFSSAGKRNEGGGRASLTINYANVIAQYRPSFFLMENVARAATSKAFQAALGIFKAADYGLTIKLLNAAHCGAPQLRKRLIVIGHLHAKDGFLDAALERGQSKEPLTLRQYFGDQLDFDYYYRHPRSYARRGVFGIDEPSPTIRGVNRPIPKGYPGHAGDPIAVSDQIRALTTRERASIQTFPPDFQLPGSKSDVEQVIGNAVPVALAQYIASCLLEYSDQSKGTVVTTNENRSFPSQLFEPSPPQYMVSNPHRKLSRSVNKV
jgi:DNA (cytosine-5)-methyltransferase 1